MSKGEKIIEKNLCFLFFPLTFNGILDTKYKRFFSSTDILEKSDAQNLYSQSTQTTFMLSNKWA